MKKTIKLPKSFIGAGEVRGFLFTKKLENEKAYIYEVCNGKYVYFEVFLKKTKPICIDFENNIYSEIEFKERYPNSKDFGKWAFCIYKYDKAVSKFNQISK